MSIMSLWLPIVASAAAIWLFSALVWTVFPWHKSDFEKVADQDAVRAALQGNAPGYYSVPYYCNKSQDDAAQAELKSQYDEGPVAFITVTPSGWPQMGGRMARIFLYYLLVGCVCAYFVSRTLAADAAYLSVFRIAGTTAFCSYGMAYFQDSIWFGRPWSLTAKSLFDALLYALITGGMFGWLA